ncbi:unnamed protein product (mitochondrion) [Plasmodiophora brassicae]|uniref:Uncharacterized protein n=1 Tax=Plasmodiophora brassicae TaxID=37360 RepID=A0A0G4IRL4_PLABS|nr:hypothetical protein PBRA_006024 [Plasmodiophora brassicae]SPQ98126.1 unnamed protein product [Plasmodiophora brassicae]
MAANGPERWRGAWRRRGQQGDDEADRADRATGVPSRSVGGDQARVSPTLSITAAEFVPLAWAAPIEVNLRVFVAHRLEPTISDQYELRSTFQVLLREVRRVFPEAIVAVCGSVSMGLNLRLPHSDLDITVEMSGAVEPRTGLIVLAQVVRSALSAEYDVQFIDASVPIIKVQHGTTTIDVGLDQPNVFQARDFFLAVRTMFPTLRPLVLFLKYFLLKHECQRTWQGGIGSFLLKLMVLSHLQMHCRKSTMALAGTHLLTFFELYGRAFRYDQHCISVRDGGMYLPKTKHFPESNREHLCVENPFDPSIDVGQKAFNIQRIRLLFLHAYGMLLERPHRPLLDLLQPMQLSDKADPAQTSDSSRPSTTI